MGAAAGSSTGCLIKKGKLLPAEAAHSRPGHVGSTSIYSPFSSSQGSGLELPAWQLAWQLPYPDQHRAGPLPLPRGSLQRGIAPRSSTDPGRTAGCLPRLLPFPQLHGSELRRLPCVAAGAGGSAGCGVSACCASWRDHTRRVQVRSVTTEPCFATGSSLLALPLRSGACWLSSLTVGLTRVCPVLWTGPEEPPALAGAQLEARWSLAPLILRQASHWQLPGRACVLLPRHASPLQHGKGVPGAGTSRSFGGGGEMPPDAELWIPPGSEGTPVPCRGLSAPCDSLQGGCGLTGWGRQRAGFHVKRAIKGRNLLTWRSV